MTPKRAGAGAAALRQRRGADSSRTRTHHPPAAVETPTKRKRRTDRMKGKLEPLVKFGTFELFSEKEWQAAKGA